VRRHVRSPLGGTWRAFRPGLGRPGAAPARAWRSTSSPRTGPGVSSPRSAPTKRNVLRRALRGSPRLRARQPRAAEAVAERGIVEFRRATSGQSRAPSAGLAMIIACEAIFSAWHFFLMSASVPRTTFSSPASSPSARPGSAHLPASRPAQRVLHFVQQRDRQEDAQRRAMGRERVELLARRHRRAAGDARQDHGLRDFGQRQRLAGGSGRGHRGRHARHDLPRHAGGVEEPRHLDQRPIQAGSRSAGARRFHCAPRRRSATRPSLRASCPSSRGSRSFRVHTASPPGRRANRRTGCRPPVPAGGGP